MNQPPHCKYTPFETYLGELSSTQSTLTLTFDQIESAMGSPLPKSAYLRLTWWDNAIHSTLSNKHAWLNAGWHVETVELAGKLVRFVQSK